MYNIESKKLLILRILKILETYSDMEHPLKHSKILELLRTEFNIECERKAIGRNISFLIEGGYPVASSRKGVYIESRLFDNSELKLLIDSILASRHINSKHSQQLIDKLGQLGGIHFKKKFKNLKVSDWDKSPNMTFFLNIEQIDEAIERCRKIEFIYNCYDINKKLCPKKADKYIVNPYFMMLHNQRYYLICNVDKHDNLSNFRIDRITDLSIRKDEIKPIEALPEIKSINPARIATEHPYMFTGESDYIVLETEKSYIGDIIDWFGENFCVDEVSDDIIRVRLKANFSAIRYWALQYGTNIKIIEPECLKEIIVNEIKVMASKYEVAL